MDDQIVDKQQQFNQMFSQHQHGVYRVLYRILGTRAEAEDLLQEAFVRLHGHWDEIEGTKRKAWLYQVASNLGLNMIRDTKRRKRWHEEAAQSTHSARSTQENPAQTMAVRKAMQALPKRQAKLLVLYAAGLNHKELAEAMGVKKTSLSQLLLRAKRAFEQEYTFKNGEQ